MMSESHKFDTKYEKMAEEAFKKLYATKYFHLHDPKSSDTITHYYRDQMNIFQAAFKLLMPIIECQSKGLNEIVDKYFDLPVEARMQKGIKEGKESLIARHALKQVEEMLKEIGGRG